VLGDLIGTGLLAMPIAAAHAGWLLGGIFLLVMAAATLWTLKILIRIIERDRRLRSFTDVVGHGLGPRVQYWLTCFFIVEFLVWK
jgi:vesicular inhibitory amino acid transporter